MERLKIWALPELRAFARVRLSAVPPFGSIPRHPCLHFVGATGGRVALKAIKLCENEVLVYDTDVDEQLSPPLLSLAHLLFFGQTLTFSLYFLLYETIEISFFKNISRFCFDFCLLPDFRKRLRKKDFLVGRRSQNGNSKTRHDFVLLPEPKIRPWIFGFAREFSYRKFSLGFNSTSCGA